MRQREPWYDSDNPTRVARGATWRAGVWVVGLVVFFGLIGIGTWGFKVATSDVKGRGDVVRKTNDADNRISAQEHFVELKNKIDAYGAQLTAQEAVVRSDPSEFNRVNLNGLQQQCISAVGQYNGDALKVTQWKFRDADLPEKFDASTACHIGGSK